MAKKIKIGLIREGKVPPDKRVPLTPLQCKSLMSTYDNVEIVAQPSAIRAFKDQEYSSLGIRVQEDLNECEWILGVKEVNIEDLIPNKKFMFFSHTIKKQPYNRNLLRAILERNIQLVDYEALKDKYNKRIIGFGRYAGIVGCYNGVLTYGLKHKLYEIKPAHLCADRAEVEEELKKVVLPANTKIVLTGFGRVGHGAKEIIDLLPIKEVTPKEFLQNEFSEPVYTHLDTEDYFAPIQGGEFDKNEFYSDPSTYKSIFAQYLSKSDMYIACHFWNNKADFIITREDLKASNLRLSVVADISCDIDGPVACTLRPSKIGDAIYGYCPEKEAEVNYMDEGAIAVMAVDNLPCELPLDASEDFGNELIKKVMPCILRDDPDNVIGRATETNHEGELTNFFAYLGDYVTG